MFDLEVGDACSCAISWWCRDEAVDGPNGSVVSSLKPRYPVVLFSVAYHLGVLILQFAVFFVDGVFEDVALDEMVYFARELADFLVFEFQVGHPPSFHEWSGCGYGHVFVYDSVECVCKGF